LPLLRTRRFGPIFAVQFLGAFNDNLLKFALLFLASFGLYAAEPGKTEMLATVATGLFILPYFLFSALAGQIADASDKATLVRLIKAAEIFIMLFGLLGFWLQSVPILLATLFLMGLQSTIFGPVKYSILPQHLAEREIMGGTGLIQAGTFVAILGGQLLGGIIQPLEAGLVAAALAVVGFLASLGVPTAPPTAPGLKIDYNFLRSTAAILRAVRGPVLWAAMMGISWFFAVGALLLSQFAPLVSGVLGARQEVATLFLLVFSISVAIGSLAVNKLLRGEVSTRYVPLAALGMGVFMIDLWLTTSSYRITVPGATLEQFVQSAGSWRILGDLAGIAVAGGMFIVPLYAILQTQSSPEERSRTIAANNVINAGVTVAVVAALATILAKGVSITAIIGLLGLATSAVGLIFWLVLRRIASPSPEATGAGRN
jgi:acyl-[acyl-carrier-protein]-phospholipid O-acyltransferase/long-chain-fatty-acid--[acyl-carrier-protein] ligase